MHGFPTSFLVVVTGLTMALAETYDLPLLLINTQGAAIQDEPKITANLCVIDLGTNSPADSLAGDSYTIGIEVRGQTSASFDKKGYGFEIRNAADEGVDVALLGLPASDDWVLHGPFIDKSLMRNALAHYLYRATGRYSSRSRFVELFLNDEYEGVYLLLEKVKRDKNRVNISKLTETDISGDALTGGYIFRIDKSDNINDEGFLSSDNLQFIFHYPKKEAMVEQQETYLKSTINQFENLMDASNWADANTGYSSLLDVDAAVDYILLEEMTKNSDAYDVSFYMFKDRDSEGGKINLGPPWDFNLAFGAVSYNSAMDTTGWEVQLNLNAGTYKIPEWLKKIFGDAAFQTRLKARWAELRSSVWHSASIDGFMDSISTLLTSAAARNFNRWPILGSATCVNMGTGFFSYNFCFNGYSEPTWDAEVSHLNQWFHSRIHWMDSQLGFVEPADPVVKVTAPPVQKNNGDEPWCEKSGNVLYLKNGRGGSLALYNLEGRRLWSRDISAGTTHISLPPDLRGSILWATWNGRALLLHMAAQ